MISLYYFILGLLNSLLLIVIFFLRKHKLDLVKRYNWIYLLLGIPGLIGIYLSVTEDGTIQYLIFLIIFMAFLFLEWLLDYVMKLDFRDNFKDNLAWVIPYLSLYYAMNYGFIVMPWKTHLSLGIVMLCLFIVQIIVNIWSHPKQKQTITKY